MEEDEVNEITEQAAGGRCRCIYIPTRDNKKMPGLMTYLLLIKLLLNPFQVIVIIIFPIYMIFSRHVNRILARGWPCDTTSMPLTVLCPD
ncbi:hypothetical protein C2W62_24285 [Candidatus Entotheonella serta]|nr:hypothetical protein C2W62_24285 [Candidatus Entotheonella serta]